jgi:hypothetical protein
VVKPARVARFSRASGYYCWPPARLTCTVLRITGRGSARRRRWLRDRLCSRLLAGEHAMSDRKPIVLRNWSPAWVPVAIAFLIIAAIVIT